MRFLFYLVALAFFAMGAFDWKLPFLQGVAYLPAGLAALTIALAPWASSRT